MQCSTHNKPSVGSCQWCGKLLCKFDVAKAMGKKLFCKNCSTDLSGHIQRRQLEELKKQRESENRDKEYSHLFDS